MSGNKGNHGKLFPKSKPVAISVACYSAMSSHGHPRKQPFDSGTSGYSLPHTDEAVKSSRRPHCCPEPSTDDQRCSLSYLRWDGDYSKKQHKFSCEAGYLHGEEGYLKWHNSLQMEGQKLINQNLVLGIKVGKSSATNPNTEKFSPSRLNICSRMSYSSTSSLRHLPIWLITAFFQIFEHSMFIPAETFCPIDCTFQAQREQEDFYSSSLISGMSGPSSGQASSYQSYTKTKRTP